MIDWINIKIRVFVDECDCLKVDYMNMVKCLEVLEVKDDIYEFWILKE